MFVMRRILFIFLVLLCPLCPRPAGAVIVSASVNALRLDAQTVRLEVSQVGAFPEGDPYLFFDVPPVSPFGDPVFLGPYGDPWSVLQGDFGTPTGFEGDVNLLGPGETLAFGHDYSIDVLSPPWEGLVSLGLHVAQDYFYEYPLPDGSVVRDLVGQLAGDLHFVGRLPAGVGTTAAFVVTPEPPSLELWAGALVLLGCCVLPARRPRG